MAKLRNYTLKNFSKGYNSYVGSRSQVEDEEIPQGAYNVVLDDNGSASKVAGMEKYCSEALGGVIRGMAQMKTATINKLIVASGTAWYDVETDDKTALTGMTFTADKETFFCQALGRLYGCNGTDKLAYTADGATITEVTSNGNVGNQIVFYNQRLYMTNASNRDRVYYSNPYASDGTVGNLGTFDTDLSASPVKNAGFLMFDPGSGEEITHLRVVKNYLYVYTKRNVWRVSASATLNDDNSVNHTIELLVEGNGTPSPRGAVQVGNDIWHYNYDNIYSLGEVANFANIRSTTKSARVKSEINSIATAGRDNVAMGQYKEKVYAAYQTGDYNDRIEAYDVRLNAWSAPIQGKNINCFLDYEDSDGTHRFLGGSSNAGYYSSTLEIDQSQTVADSSTATLGTATRQKRAQQFLPTKANLAKIVFRRGSVSGTFTGNITVTIEGTNGTDPDGTPLATRVFTSAQWISYTANTDITIDMPATLTVDGSTKYFIVFSCSTADNTNYASLRHYNSTDPYPNGSFMYYSGSAWVAATTDLYFKTLYYPYIEKSHIYQLESGTDDDGVAIDAMFETKSTDCGLPGLVKRFAFIEVFYSMVYGTLSYEVKIDETTSTTGSQQLGNSTSRPVGIGSMGIGSFVVGSEYDSSTEFADLAQNSSFTIDCGFEEGKRIAVKFFNSSAGEQFKINGIKIWFKEGSPYESLT